MPKPPGMLGKLQRGLAEHIQPSRGGPWQWYRKARGGLWLKLCAYLVPGCPEFWHSPGLEPAMQMTTRVVEMERW